MRRARLVFAAALCALALPAASARAADPVIVSHPGLGGLSALNGNLVYPLKVTKGKPFVCMRRVGGKLLRARLPREVCGAGGLVLDSRGRVIYLYGVYRSKGVSVRWYVYDVKRDRRRRVTGLPGGCKVNALAIWRKRTVYAAKCPSKQRSGVWAKDGKKTTRIVASGDFVDGFVLRGGTLAGFHMVGDDEFEVYQLMVGGKRCVRAIEGAHKDLENGEVGGLWIVNGNIVWARGYFHSDVPAPYAGLFTAKVPSHCAAPGPYGRFEFNPETTDLRWLDLDGRQVYTGTSLATLTPVGGPSSWPASIQFNAVAGQQYWIDIGSSDAQANYMPLYASVVRP